MARGRRAGAGRLHGVIVVDKPAGWTSHDVVARVRRLTGERRVGHAGTLDPAATGVLPVLVGDATKVVEFLSDADKSYRAGVTLGVRTDSADGDGAVISTWDGPLPGDAEVEAALGPLRGEIRQVPPMHSAVQVGGQRLYELARRGETIEREARSVTVHRLDLVARDGPHLLVDVTCSKGTYVRTLVDDLGLALGCGAYLDDLVRTATGPFDLGDAWTLGDLAAALGDDPAERWPEVATHPDDIVRGWPAAVVDAATATDWSHGKSLEVRGDAEPSGTATSPSPDGATGGGTSSGGVRVYGHDGAWLGIGRAGDGSIRPWKVVGGTDGPAR